MDEVRIHETPYIDSFFPQRKAPIVAGTGKDVWPEAEAGTGETKADAVVKTGVGEIEIFGKNFESASFSEGLVKSCQSHLTVTSTSYAALGLNLELTPAQRRGSILHADRHELDVRTAPCDQVHWAGPSDALVLPTPAVAAIHA